MLRLDRRRLLLIGVLGLGSAGLLLGLAGGRAAIATLAEANWAWIALAVLVHYSSFALRGHRWQRILAVLGHRLPYFYTTSLLLAGWFASALLPARAGDLLRVGVLRLGSPRQGAAPVPVPVGLSSVVLERVLDILAIVTLGAAFGFALLRDRLPAWLLGAYAGGLFLLLLFGLGLLLAPPLLGWLRRLSQRRPWQVAVDFVAHFIDGLRTLFRHPLAAALVIGESLAIWLADALLVYLVVLSLGAPLSWPATAFVALTVDVLAAVPLTPGGVGQIDAAYAALLALLALPATQVGAIVLLVRFISYWSFLVFSGLVTLVGGFGSLLPSAFAAATGPVTGPSAAHAAGSFTGTVAEPSAGPVARPVAEPVAEPAATGLAAEHATGRTTEYATSPVAAPAVTPAAHIARQPQAADGLEAR